jgi:serine/threonine protein kinase
MTTVDPRADTLAVASAEAGSAARTLTNAAGTPPSAGAAPRADLVGRHFAHFRIERPLGGGGMGDVYLATDIALDRPVALKLLKPEAAADPVFRERFVREARAQARIQHPNVCHIYFIGEQDAQLFFAMEYVDGETLQHKLAREGKLPPDEALEICRQAALGLAEANRHGFTHRDVKPSNVIVDKRGVVKVVDFGIVKEQKGDVASTADKGDIVGTPLYMAPEQARGEPVDFRSDMYSLGATLHHLVSGAPPFQGDTPLAVISKHLSDPRPRLAARAPKARASRVDALCDRMMAKRPAERFPSYDALLDALERASFARSRPAGFWVRVFAFALDSLILQITLIPSYILLPGGMWSFLTISALYSIVSHARWGKSIGKLALEIEVVADGRTRGIGLRRAAIRWLVMWGPLAVASAVSELVEKRSDAADIVVTLIGVAGLLVCLAFGLSAVFAEGKRAVWDRAAGTSVRYRRG